VLTTADNKQMVKVFAWYDNEYSYTCQYIRLALEVGRKVIKK
jgi:glyceraldehyde 3-phosphate dehydrogenase